MYSSFDLRTIVSCIYTHTYIYYINHLKLFTLHLSNVLLYYKLLNILYNISYYCYFITTSTLDWYCGIPAFQHCQIAKNKKLLFATEEDDSDTTILYECINFLALLLF